MINKQTRKLVRFLEQVLVCIKNQYLQHKQIKRKQMEKEIQRGKEIRENKGKKNHLSPTRRHQFLQPLQTSGGVLGKNDKKIKN